MSGYQRIVAFGLLAFVFSAYCSVQAEPLKGSVEDTAPLEPSKSENLKPIEPMVAPVVPEKKKPLEGAAEDSGKKPLEGGANDEDSDLKGMTPTTAKGGVLKGNASMEDLAKQDPDAEDQELMVQWDKWRNRLLWAIQSGMQETLNSPDETMLRWDPERQVMMSRFPMGTSAWFYCKVSNDRHIIKVKLLRSSGYPNYDKAVLDAVQSLEGSSILKFPARSRRPTVDQTAGIKTSDTEQRQFFKFGDTERYTVPGGQ